MRLTGAHRLALVCLMVGCTEAAPASVASPAPDDAAASTAGADPHQNLRPLEPACDAPYPLWRATLEGSAALTGLTQLRDGRLVAVGQRTVEGSLRGLVAITDGDVLRTIETGPDTPMFLTGVVELADGRILAAGTLVETRAVLVEVSPDLAEPPRLVHTWAGVYSEWSDAVSLPTGGLVLVGSWGTPIPYEPTRLHVHARAVRLDHTLTPRWDRLYGSGHLGFSATATALGSVLLAGRSVDAGDNRDYPVWWEIDPDGRSIADGGTPVADFGRALALAPHADGVLMVGYVWQAHEHGNHPSDAVIIVTDHRGFRTTPPLVIGGPGDDQLHAAVQTDAGWLLAGHYQDADQKSVGWVVHLDSLALESETDLAASIGYSFGDRSSFSDAVRLHSGDVAVAGQSAAGGSTEVVIAVLSPEGSRCAAP